MILQRIPFPGRRSVSSSELSGSVPGRTLPIRPPRPHVIERELDRQQRARVEALPGRDPLPPLTPWLRRFYRLDEDDAEGFVTIAQASEMTGQSEDELRSLTARGILRSHGFGPALRVELAVVTLVTVVDR